MPVSKFTGAGPIRLTTRPGDLHRRAVTRLHSAYTPACRCSRPKSQPHIRGANTFWTGWRSARPGRAMFAGRTAALADYQPLRKADTRFPGFQMDRAYMICESVSNRFLAVCGSPNFATHARWRPICGRHNRDRCCNAVREFSNFHGATDTPNRQRANHGGAE